MSDKQKDCVFVNFAYVMHVKRKFVVVTSTLCLTFFQSHFLLNKLSFKAKQAQMLPGKRLGY